MAKTHGRTRNLLKIRKREVFLNEEDKCLNSQKDVRWVCNYNPEQVLRISRRDEWTQNLNDKLTNVVLELAPEVGGKLLQKLAESFNNHKRSHTKTYQNGTKLRRYKLKAIELSKTINKNKSKVIKNSLESDSGD